MLYTQRIWCSSCETDRCSRDHPRSHTACSVSSERNFEPLCRESQERNQHTPAGARGHVAISSTQIPHYSSRCSLAEEEQKLSSASVTRGTRCHLIRWWKHEAIDQIWAVCCSGDGQNSGAKVATDVSQAHMTQTAVWWALPHMSHLSLGAILSCHFWVPLSIHAEHRHPQSASGRLLRPREGTWLVKLILLSSVRQLRKDTCHRSWQKAGNRRESPAVHPWQ